MNGADGIAYSGPAELEPALTSALRNVIDPEMAVNIVDLGLVYGVNVDATGVHVRITMTSAACPVSEMILADAEAELEAALGPDMPLDVQLCWDPPWTPALMSPKARAALWGD